MSKKAHYMYVLSCQDGTLYTGYTPHLKARLKTHNAGKGAKYTRPAFRRPCRLIYAEKYDQKSLAMAREYAFKQLRRPQKLAYLTQQGVKPKKGQAYVLCPGVQAADIKKF